MAVNLSPVGGVAAQFFDNNGNPLTGGKIYTYAAGTTTNQTTYTSSAGTTAHSNPIILDSAGRVPGGEIWLTDNVSYKFVLQTSTNVLIATYDNITGINSNFVNFTAQQEIQTATAGQTVFNLTTTQYQPGTNSLTVYVDGVNQYGPGAQYAYLETDSDTVTFVSGLHVGASVKFTTVAQATGAATDAEQVSYNPPFTGGVATNVENKLAQTVSVKDFGAVGDGVVNDTTAIQNALSSGQPIYFPPGTYLSDTLTTTSDNTTVYGPRSAVINFNTGGTPGAFGFLVNHNNFTISGLTLNTVVRGSAIRVIPTNSSGITDVTIENTKFINIFYAVRAGLEVSSINNWRIRNIRVVNCDSEASIGNNAGHFFCTLSDGVLYQGNTVTYGKNSSAYGIARCTKIVIANNRETLVEDTIVDVEAAIQIEDCANSQTVITGNVCNHDIWVSGSQDVVISANKCRDLRISIGNPSDPGVNRVKFIGNNAGRIRCAPFAISPPPVLYSRVEFIDNILDPGAYTKLGSPLNQAVVIDGGNFAGTVVLRGNNVVSSAAQYAVQMSRTGAAFELIAKDNNFGSMPNLVTGFGGYVFEIDDVNPLYVGSLFGGDYIVAALTTDLAPSAFSTFTTLPFTAEGADVNLEFNAGVFVPKKSGTYELYGAVGVNPDATNDIANFRLFRSSGTPTEICRFATTRAVSADLVMVNLQYVRVYLTAGETYEFQFFVTGATMVFTSGVTTRFNIRRMS